MLQIKNISKKYKTGGLVQTALNNVSLNLRESEFVAILGPSGSGKTTLLNVIGGLDRYDSGDLVINNVSTKNYKDRDWDTYRNHTIGFVFQSYNLIPHQTILSNVELALTISGISKKERRKRALIALEEVGLADQAHKKPNQMSGGQMQRVAIARALVNNPDVLLADEPTGALDTKTSVQVMDLLKEVAKDRLVVMVTHNPELANEYANRIIRLQDGVVMSDSNPFMIAETELKKKADKVKKARMSIFTALSLSFNNLLTKKGRTILIAFAGSIGIIGIALILSLSQGFQNYIDKIQEDTLSSYPLTLTSDTADMTSAILSMVTDRQENVADGENVIERQYLTTMFSSIGTNDLKSFKQYLQNHEDEYSSSVSQIKYSYSITPNIYTIDAAENLVKLYPSSMWNMLYSNGASSFMSSFSSASGGMIFSEIPDDLDSVKDQYDVLKGRWPERFDEMIIVLSEPNSISDLLVYSLGLRDTSELRTIISSLMSQEEIEIENDPKIFSYDYLMGLDLRLIKSTDTYAYVNKYNVYEDMSSNDDYMRLLFDNSLKLKIVGIVCPSDQDSTLALSPGVNFRSDLTQYIIDEAKKTKIVQEQIANKNTDIFSGKGFEEENDSNKNDNKLNFEEMISVDEDMIKDAFKINIDEDSFLDADDIQQLATVTTNSIVSGLVESAPIKVLIQQMSKGVSQAMISTYCVANVSSPIPGSSVDESNVDTYASTFFASPEYDTAVSAIIASLPPNLQPLLTKDAITDLTKDISTSIYTQYFTDYDPTVTMSISPPSITISPDVATEIDGYLADPSNPINPVINTKTAEMVKNINSASVGLGMLNVIQKCMEPLSALASDDLMTIDTDKFSKAFKFDMKQDELSRLMETIMSGTEEKSYKSNLISLGYQDVDDPTSISFYFKDFESKENFLNFLNGYNDNLDEESKVKYTDITGILMSGIKTIVDSVTYVLIAFVSISLVVSSIMIAVITLISVMERTKEIGILRAMGASKHNVSSIFNAETFIIGLLSGLLGIGVTYFSIPFINNLIHNVTGNYDINAVLPQQYAIILVFISVVLTIVAGIIPSKKASKQDPVIALRSE